MTTDTPQAVSIPPYVIRLERDLAAKTAELAEALRECERLTDKLGALNLCDPDFLHKTILRAESAEARLHDVEQKLAESAREYERQNSLLRDAETAKDGAYLERNQVVSALSKCFPSGVARTAIEGWSEDWHGCVYIDLPTGQVSWHFHDSQAYLFAHLPPYKGKWDGHDTPEKYRRLAAIDAEQGKK